MNVYVATFVSGRRMVILADGAAEADLLARGRAGGDEVLDDVGRLGPYEPGPAGARVSEGHGPILADHREPVE